MKQRLERAGQRSISALVDVTNYVMLELGRPLHVYDLDKLQGGSTCAGAARARSCMLLNEQTVELDESVLCITDDSGVDRPGRHHGRREHQGRRCDTTQHVPRSRRSSSRTRSQGRARRYNFTSDAAHRFERGVDFDNNVDGIERATRADPRDLRRRRRARSTDQSARLPERKPVRMRAARAQKVHRHAAGGERDRRRLHAAGLAVHARRQASFTRHAALATASTSRSRKT